MAVEVQSLTSFEQYERIAQYACVAVGATDSGILLRRSNRQFHAARGTSDAVEKAHHLQVECDEGPCLEAIGGTDSTYATGDAPNDPRWPTWGSRVGELGFRSVVSRRLATHDRIYGSLNAYSTSVNAFAPGDVEVMEYLGAHASAAIASSQDVEHLGVALETRSQIGQAQGLLMAVYDLDPDGAFQFMRRLSQDSNTKLAEIAKQIIEQRTSFDGASQQLLRAGPAKSDDAPSPG